MIRLLASFAAAVCAAAQPAPSPGPAVEAVTRFASSYINWDAGDLTAKLASLARSSVGQARSEMELAAAETAGDSTIRQGGVANRGDVEAVVALRGAGARYVVVTRETTSASATASFQGLAPAWHVTIATVTDRGGRWVLSGWQPES